MKDELKKLYKDVNIGVFFKMRRLRWLGRVQLMGGARSKNLYQVKLCHKNPKRKPKAMWKHYVVKAKQSRYRPGVAQRVPES